MIILGMVVGCEVDSFLLATVVGCRRSAADWGYVNRLSGVQEKSEFVEVQNMQWQ